MRVFQIEGNWGLENLRLSQRPEPVPRDDQILIRMHAASLNARDLIVPNRGYGRATGELPLIPVSDGVGTVIGVGSRVTRMKPGDRVCPTYFQNWIAGEPTPDRFASALGGPLDGVMADLVCLSEQGAVLVPDYLTHEEAATLPCAALTAWSAIAIHARTKPGDRVLIQGTGGVALFALAFAKLHGGEMHIESRMGAGTSVSVRLPVLLAPLKAPPPPTEPLAEPVAETPAPDSEPPTSLGDNVIAFSPR